MSVVDSTHGFTLSDNLLDFRSSESRKRLVRCMNEGTALPYLHLSSCYKPQTEPAYCGITTLVVVLNALGIDPKTTWKTPWRWFTEEGFERSMDALQLSLVKSSGISMDEFRDLAKENGATCSLIRARDTEGGYGEFLDDLYRICSGKRTLQVNKNSQTIHQCLHEEYPNQVMAISFDRESLNQHGEGHFSPVAAFDLTSSSVLVLDTARFKYPPYWAPANDLYRSMIPKDKVTGKSRGYLIVGKPDTQRIPYLRG